jgi:CBS domain containing-hemolysin-like protein
MEIIVVGLHLLAVALFLIVTGVRPAHTTLSQFELTRRAAAGDKDARTILRREQLIGDVYSIQRVSAAVLLVIVSFLGVVAYEWTIGIIIALLIALEAAVVAHFPPLQRQSQKLYERVEPALIRFVERFPHFLRLIRTVAPPVEDATIDSKEELRHMVSRSGTLLSDDERSIIMSSLTFNSRLVKDVMTPRGVIDTISKTEVLGPVVLDDLHQTGHSRIPVIDKDIDHVVGMLYLRDLLVIDGEKRYSRTVEKAMHPKVYYIKEDQNLGEALAAFIKTHHHLFIVVNEFRETVGLLTLEDVLEALLGSKIVDEFDAHDNLREVAARNPRHNNTPEKHSDV